MIVAINSIKVEHRATATPTRDAYEGTAGPGRSVLASRRRFRRFSVQHRC
jgi:hypothetical protein